MYFRSCFLNKTKALLVSPCMLHTLHISSLVWFLQEYFVNSRDYVIFFIPRITLPCYTQLSFSATLIPNTLKLCSSLLVRDQLSRSYKTSWKVTVLSVLISTFLVANTKADDSLPNSSRHPPSTFRWCWFSCECSFHMLRSFTNISTLPNIQRFNYVFMSWLLYRAFFTQVKDIQQILISSSLSCLLTLWHTNFLANWAVQIDL
jgi:hypothetical protein